MTDFHTEMWMRHDIYMLFENYKEMAVKDGSFEKLDKESKRFVDQTLLGFKRSGLTLPYEKRKELE